VTWLREKLGIGRAELGKAAGVWKGKGKETQNQQHMKGELQSVFLLPHLLSEACVLSPYPTLPLLNTSSYGPDGAAHSTTLGRRASARRAAAARQRMANSRNSGLHSWGAGCIAESGSTTPGAAVPASFRHWAPALSLASDSPPLEPWRG